MHQRPVQREPRRLSRSVEDRLRDVNTPLLPVPLTGPAIFVSHGGEAFPSLTIVLQGDNVTVNLVGTTFISKAGITSTTFKSVPDVPFKTFTLTLPQGKYSALAANGNLCKLKLKMPTVFNAQNGSPYTSPPQSPSQAAQSTRQRPRRRSRRRRPKRIDILSDAGCRRAAQVSATARAAISRPAKGVITMYIT